MGDADGPGGRPGRADPTALIESDPRVMLGKPVVKGTRLTVELILEKLAGGSTLEDLLRGYPRLTEAGVRAALAYAARVLGSDVVYLDAAPPAPAAPAAPAPTTEVAG
jgi:uncharacterized protein (DUF433 family)